MENVLNMFTTVLAEENDLSQETAARLVNWLEDEGALDYAILKETYGA